MGICHVVLSQFMRLLTVFHKTVCFLVKTRQSHFSECSPVADMDFELRERNLGAKRQKSLERFPGDKNAPASALIAPSYGHCCALPI